MPIYAYRCASCGHAKDVLQKLSDPPLETCPACGASAFAKQVTAAGFQLKGSGWYATDFKGNGAKKPDSGDATKADGTKTDAAAPDTAKPDTAKPGDSSAPSKAGDVGTPSSGAATDSGSSSSTPKAPSGGAAPAGH
jgi:putative FmdB family regulatory protein